jgi:hypothetical protein
LILTVIILIMAIIKTLPLVSLALTTLYGGALSATGFIGNNFVGDTSDAGAGANHVEDAAAAGTTPAPQPDNGHADHGKQHNNDIPGLDFLGFGDDFYSFAVNFYSISRWYSVDNEHHSSVLVSSENTSCITVSVSATDIAQASEQVLSSYTVPAASAEATPTLEATSTAEATHTVEVKPTETSTAVHEDEHTTVVAEHTTESAEHTTVSVKSTTVAEDAETTAPTETTSHAEEPESTQHAETEAKTTEAAAPTTHTYHAPTNTGEWKTEVNATTGTATGESMPPTVTAGAPALEVAAAGMGALVLLVAAGLV